jgi:hypothetical protein
MRFVAIKNVLTSSVTRNILFTKKHSPVMLFAVGVGGFIGTVVLATRATFKMDEVVKEAEGQTRTVEANQTISAISEKDAAKELKQIRINTAVKVGKLYAPAVGLGVLSIGALTGAHVIQFRRLGGISAAYAALDQGFRAYRERVVTEYGADKDAQFRHGLVETQVVVSDGPEGPEFETVLRPDPNNPAMIYARVFEKGNPNWSPDRHKNQAWIQAQQQYANDRLNRYGYLFLSDVYKSLGFEETQASRVVGWIKGGNGDDFVDFGLFRGDTYSGIQFVNGEIQSVLLDFNVDGEVLRNLKKH